MSTTQVNLALQMLSLELFSTTEVPTGSSDDDRTMKITPMQINAVLNATSTPKVDKPPIYTKLAATATIDLTAVQAAAIPSTATRMVDMTSAKVVGFAMKAPSTNAAAVNVAPGSVHPYPLMGTANDFDVKPGEYIAKVFSAVASSLPLVSATVKKIDVTISGSDTIEILLLLGT